MIAFVDSVDELKVWAARQAEQAQDDYIRTGATLSLGYALAMSDIANSVVVSRPGLRAVEQRFGDTAELSEDMTQRAA